MAERVRVRDLDVDEGNRLLRIVRRDSGSVVTWRRAQMVLLSPRGMDVPAIARVRFTAEDRVRAVIHKFDDDGFETLYPRYRGGRPRASRCRSARRSRRSPCPDRRIMTCPFRHGAWPS
jgi:Winged helix-turn helix